MKNTLNPCKCGSSEGGAEFSSQITYNGLDVSCIPGLVGQNLSQVIKALGDFACGISGGTQLLTVNVGEPTGGSEGDIWIRQQGNAITFYQNVAASWMMRGQIFLSTTSVQDDSYDLSTTSAQIETDHPGMPVGSIVYSETSGFQWTRLEANKWTRSTLDIA